MPPCCLMSLDCYLQFVKYSHMNVETCTENTPGLEVAELMKQEAKKDFFVFAASLSQQTRSAPGKQILLVVWMRKWEREAFIQREKKNQRRRYMPASEASTSMAFGMFSGGGGESGQINLRHNIESLRNDIL